MLAVEKCQKTQLRTDTLLVVTFLPRKLTSLLAGMIYILCLVTVREVTNNFELQCQTSDSLTAMSHVSNCLSKQQFRALRDCTVTDIWMFSFQTTGEREAGVWISVSRVGVRGDVTCARRRVRPATPPFHHLHHTQLRLNPPAFLHTLPCPAPHSCPTWSLIPQVSILAQWLCHPTI